MNVVVVLEVLDGNTLNVTPQDRAAESYGTVIRIHGMSAPPLSTFDGQFAQSRLRLLLLGSPVVVRTIRRDERGALVCELEHQGLPLWQHMREFADPELLQPPSAPVFNTVLREDMAIRVDM